jgi:Macrocin-O-methyltransferase (TylF)
MSDWSERYNSMAAAVFGRPLPSDVRTIFLMSDYPKDSVWFDKCYQALLQIEFEYVEQLLQHAKGSKIVGDLVEFGIYQGAWINKFYEITTRIGLNRNIWGFDSFAGLSKPHESYDIDFWKEGMYAVSRAEVEKQVQAKRRPRIRLVEGFFRESLKTPEAQCLGPVCFARIDCDIYEPTLDCLSFLSSRLSDGAILVFDDWSFSPDVGETRAFFEWVKTTPHLRFEYLSHGPWGHLYLRVRHH